MNNSSKSEIINRAHVKIGGQIAQTIYSPGNSGFLLKSGDEIDYADSIPFNDNITYEPIESIYLDHRQIIVPSDIIECQPDLLSSELLQYYKDNLLIDEELAILLTGYTIYSWLYDKTYTAPYLYLIGEPGSAKSRILDLMACTCFNSTILGVSVTAANIFRMQDMARGTQFIDEFESRYSDKDSSLVQILNNGYKYDGVVMRCESGSGKHRPVPFNVFGPKVIAARTEPQDDALRSRCFVLRLHKAAMAELNQNHIPLEFAGQSRKNAEKLRNQLLGLRFTYYHDMPAAYNKVESESLSPRAAQIINSILSVVPRKWLSGLQTALENHLFEDGISESLMHEKIIKDAITQLSGEDGDEIHPSRIPFDKIRETIKLDHGISFSPRDIGSFVKRLGHETTRTSSGMVVVCRNVDNVEDVDNIANSDVEDVESVEYVGYSDQQWN